MDKNVVVQTLLAALSSFEQLLSANHKAVANQAQYSYASKRTCFELSNELLDIIYENDTLNNLRIKLELVLRLLPEPDRKILVLKYVHDLPAFQVAEMLGISSRTVFRRLNSAAAKFAVHLENMGVTAEFYKKLLTKHLLLKNIHLRVSRCG